MELYKKYRPHALGKMVGNESTVASLKNMLRRGTLPHVLLFHGPSGCGKTTLGRIVGRMLDCETIDFREVNSSSFRGIDSVREVQRTMNLAPIGACRVYLFDEVHKWTNDAQNAALKMLEDTPERVYFLLCTTDPQKMIKAVRTRCCEMPVRLLTYEEMEVLVGSVVKKEEIELEDDIKADLISSAQGSPRTALVMLDKVANVGPEQAAEALRLASEEENEAIVLCRALIKKSSWKEVTKILKNLKGEPETVRWCVLGHARTVLLNKGDTRAYMVIEAFCENFFDSKQAGLVAACYEVICGVPF